ncbi:MAG: hypothetical protein CMK00_09010 [Planctomycetes bacterium]|nr:hypothetical protein [Planctomycetota bacterium]
MTGLPLGREEQHGFPVLVLDALQAFVVPGRNIEVLLVRGVRIQLAADLLDALVYELLGSLTL